MARIEQIPIVLLTGFLGSGKTTLLREWIKSPAFDGAMVIVNELGEVGLDHQLLTMASEVPVLLDSGCACCAASEDLIATMERLFWDRLHKRIPRFQWMLIETTGMADPVPILASIAQHNLLRERYRIAGVVAAVNAINGLDQVARFVECRRQLDAASVVVLTKTDLAAEDQITTSWQELVKLAPQADILSSANGDLPAMELVDVLSRRGAWQGSTIAARADGPDDHHGHAAHDTAHHTADVTTAFLPLPKPVEWGCLIEALTSLSDRERDVLLRAKGIVKLAGVPGYHAVQVNPGQGITRHEIPVDAGAELPRTGFTLISVGGPAAGLASLLSAELAQAVSRVPATTDGATAR